MSECIFQICPHCGFDMSKILENEYDKKKSRYLKTKENSFRKFYDPDYIQWVEIITCKKCGKTFEETNST